MDEFEGEFSRARVIEAHGEIFQVITENGVFSARKRGVMREVHIVVGDFVYIKPNDYGDAQIFALCPRRTAFSRAERSGHAEGYVKTLLEDIVAANFDIVFMLMSLNHDFNIRRLQRYIAATVSSGARGVVLLTKADKANNISEYEARIREITQTRMLTISAVTGQGLDEVRALLAPGTTAIFLGSSGVGKSTLVNTLAGEELMPTSEIREHDSKGRHTTTHRKMLFLNGGAMVIDTPGLRELGLWDAEAGIADLFADIRAAEARCRFADCRHKNEPGCAIIAALRSGEISEKRWEEYNAMMRENALGKTNIPTRRAKLLMKAAKNRLLK